MKISHRQYDENNLPATNSHLAQPACRLAGGWFSF